MEDPDARLRYQVGLAGVDLSRLPAIINVRVWEAVAGGCNAPWTRAGPGLEQAREQSSRTLTTAERQRFLQEPTG